MDLKKSIVTLLSEERECVNQIGHESRSDCEVRKQNSTTNFRSNESERTHDSRVGPRDCRG